MIRVLEHPRSAKNNGYVFEHIVVMENHLGRLLEKNETVHHKNGDKRDNNLSNLELWSRSQPAGQRVVDKVAWAIKLLELYCPEALNVSKIKDKDLIS